MNRRLLEKIIAISIACICIGIAVIIIAGDIFSAYFFAVVNTLVPLAVITIPLIITVVKEVRKKIIVYSVFGVSLIGMLFLLGWTFFANQWSCGWSDGCSTAMTIMFGSWVLSIGIVGLLFVLIQLQRKKKS